MATINELIGLLNTQCLKVGSPVESPQSKPSDLIRNFSVPILEIGSGGTYASRRFEFGVANYGVIAGPVFYAADEYSEDATFDENGALLTGTLLHAEGDPRLDENGDQIVIPDAAGETVYPKSVIQMPLMDTIVAIQYLEFGKDEHWWEHYVEDKSEEKRPDLKFFTARVWVADGANLTEKKILVTYDDMSAPTHKFVV